MAAWTMDRRRRRKGRRSGAVSTSRAREAGRLRRHNHLSTQRQVSGFADGGGPASFGGAIFRHGIGTWGRASLASAPPSVASDAASGTSLVSLPPPSDVVSSTGAESTRGAATFRQTEGAPRSHDAVTVTDASAAATKVARRSRIFLRVSSPMGGSSHDGNLSGRHASREMTSVACCHARCPQSRFSGSVMSSLPA